MRLQALDLFRFFAALSVVFYHYFPMSENSHFPGVASVAQFGYLGVPLFFMISGFVIFASAERRSPSEFIVSRATRLLPAFWIGATFTALMVYFLEPTPIGVVQYLGNLTMLNDYLGIANIDGVYWTLQAEIKFYVCIYLLLRFGFFSHYKIWLSVWAIATITFNTLQQPFFMGWFITPAYSPYFISGIVFYLIWAFGFSPYNLTMLLVAVIMSCYQTYFQAGGYVVAVSEVERCIAVCSVLLFHLLFLLLAMKKLNLKSRATYTILGAMTYPLYLIHARAGVALIKEIEADKNGLLMAAVILLMLLLAFIIYRFCEEPIAKVVKKYLQALVRKVPYKALG